MYYVICSKNIDGFAMDQGIADIDMYLLKKIFNAFLGHPLPLLLREP